MNEYLASLVYIYIGELVAFSLCLILLARHGLQTQISLGIVANIFSAIGIAMAPHVLTISGVKDLQMWGGLASLAGGVARYLSVTYMRKSFHHDRLADGITSASLLATPLVLFDALGQYRLLVVCAIGAAISAACLIGILRNPFWKYFRGFGLMFFCVGMLLSMFALIWRAATSYPFGGDQAFVGGSSPQLAGLQLLVIMSFLLQIGFIGLIVARHGHDRRFVDRRAVRATQRSLALSRRRTEIAKLSEDRLDLIQLLTHEVRQPINNAQASLQSIHWNFARTSPMPQKAKHALGRAQSSLDGITLALSNVIVAGTLIDQQKPWDFGSQAAGAALDMAKLDCNPEVDGQIIIDPIDADLFVTASPILLRVALHNLLDHALRHAAPNTPVRATAVVDEDRLGIAFRIISQPQALCEYRQDLFTRRRPDDTSGTQQSGLGMFIARQVAAIHHGELNVELDETGLAHYDLFIPS